MDNKTLYRFLEQVRQECRFAQAAFQSLRQRLNEPDPERVFLDVQAFLGHVVMVSRLLWPARSSSAERGESLRKALNVPADSPLRLAGARGQIESFDEAYEDWLASLEGTDYVEMNVMPTGTMAGSKADVFHRSLDPDTLMLRLRGIPFALGRLNEVVRSLDRTAQQWLATHRPW